MAALDQALKRNAALNLGESRPAVDGISRSFLLRGMARAREALRVGHPKDAETILDAVLGYPESRPRPYPRRCPECGQKLRRNE